MASTDQGDLSVANVQSQMTLPTQGDLSVNPQGLSRRVHRPRLLRAPAYHHQPLFRLTLPHCEYSAVWQ